VLGIPRGGVPVASRVAEALAAPLDVIVVRKLGVPGFEELAMGAIASGGARLLDDRVVRELRIPADVVDAVTARRPSRWPGASRRSATGRRPTKEDGP
jgi:predicted phosphoribosyltransferase